MRFRDDLMFSQVFLIKMTILHERELSHVYGKQE